MQIKRERLVPDGIGGIVGLCDARLLLLDALAVLNQVNLGEKIH